MGAMITLRAGWDEVQALPVSGFVSLLSHVSNELATEMPWGPNEMTDVPAQSEF